MAHLPANSGAIYAVSIRTLAHFSQITGNNFNSSSRDPPHQFTQTHPKHRGPFSTYNLYSACFNACSIAICTVTLLTPAHPPRSRGTVTIPIHRDLHPRLRFYTRSTGAYFTLSSLGVFSRRFNKIKPKSWEPNFQSLLHFRRVEPPIQSLFIFRRFYRQCNGNLRSHISDATLHSRITENNFHSSSWEAAPQLAQ